MTHLYFDEFSERDVECGDEGLRCPDCLARAGQEFEREFGLVGLTPEQRRRRLEDIRCFVFINPTTGEES